MKSFQRFDLVALFIILSLTVVISILLILGSPKPQVIAFSWDNDQQIGIQDQSFILEFNHLMNRDTVAQNLEIIPSLPGKISWSGRKMIYTLTETPDYGQEYTLRLSLAQAFTQTGQGTEIEPYEYQFRSRDLAFAYIGLQGEEQGKLMLYNDTNKSRIPLTPPDLQVVDFKLYPQGDKAIISAFDPSKGFEHQKLYTVTTGLNFQNDGRFNPVGKIRPLISDDDYQNLKFDLSNNGKTLIVERKNRQDLSNHSLWLVADGQAPQPLGLLGQDFKLSPDGQTLAIVQREGIELKPLTSNAPKRQFFPQYVKFLAFSADGRQKLMERLNEDYTRSLMLINAQGEERELALTLDPVIHCQFQPTNEETIYCAKMETVEREEQLLRRPLLLSLSISNPEWSPLIGLPNDPNFMMSFSSDGRFLLFDQIKPATSSANTMGINRKGQAIAVGRLWLFTIPEEMTTDEVKALPQEIVPGYHPQWLP